MLPQARSQQAVFFFVPASFAGLEHSRLCKTGASRNHAKIAEDAFSPSCAEARTGSIHDAEYTCSLATAMY